MKIRVRKFHVSFKQMTWPRVGGFTEDFLWRLKYGKFLEEDRHITSAHYDKSE